MNINAYSPQIIIGACAVVLLILLLIVWGVARQRSRRRTAELRARFGPEYDVAILEYGSRRQGQAIRAGHVYNRAAVHLRGDTEGNARGDIGLDCPRDNVH